MGDNHTFSGCAWRMAVAQIVEFSTIWAFVHIISGTYVKNKAMM